MWAENSAVCLSLVKIEGFLLLDFSETYPRVNVNYAGIKSMQMLKYVEVESRQVVAGAVLAPMIVLYLGLIK